MQTVVICLSIRPKRNFLPNKPFFLSARAFDHPASVRCFAGLPSPASVFVPRRGSHFCGPRICSCADNRVSWLRLCISCRSNNSLSNFRSMLFGLGCFHDRREDGDMLSDWESMTIDELFALREEMAAILSAKLMTRKTEIEKRLRQLSPSLEAEREKCGRP